MVPSVATEKIPSDTTGDRSRDFPTSSADYATPGPLSRKVRVLLTFVQAVVDVERYFATTFFVFQELFSVLWGLCCVVPSYCVFCSQVGFSNEHSV